MCIMCITYPHVTYTCSYIYDIMLITTKLPCKMAYSSLIISIYDQRFGSVFGKQNAN